MDPAIIAAIIGAAAVVIAALLAVVIPLLRKTEKSREERPIEVKVKVDQPAPPLPEKPTSPEGIPTPPTPYFAHPYPLQENFTGRLSEREELTEWFTKGEQPMFAYIAIGGMGKSALTWYWLHEDIIKNGLAPDGIIWWSFYDREASFDSFLRKAIQYTSKGEIDAKGIASTRERMDCLYHLLCNNQFLLVLDGVERVLRAYAGLGSPYQGDEVKKDEKDFRACIDPNVGTFLQWLASGKTKTLLTSRLRPKELDGIAGCFHKELKELNKEDAVDFFHRQGVKGTRAEIESACEPFGYHPLSLRLLAGMVAEDPQYPKDIKTWMEYNPLPELTGIKEEHNILELAYNALDQKKQEFTSKLSAFRSSMDYKAITIFNTFGERKEFSRVLKELVNRGILLRDESTNRYDLHPIVRRYCYERLLDKKDVHSQLRDHFSTVPKPKKVESLDDLAPVIELYHHTVNSGRYDEAKELYRERLEAPLYFQSGAYQLCIELLSALLPVGENEPPLLKKEYDQAWVLNELANSYCLSGQPKKAIPLHKRQIVIREREGAKENFAIGLGNLALDQIALGELKSAESILRRSIDLCQEIKSVFYESLGHAELGRSWAYQDRFEESEKELAKSLELVVKEHQHQSQGVVWAYRSLRALLMSDAEETLKSAKKARELSDVAHHEIDIIRAEWLLGAGYFAKGDLKEAEKHLDEALRRDRKINLVELEPDILSELAKLRFVQGRKEEALKLANEALTIADRCEYRLKQADIHNFLTEFYLDAKDFSKAKEHIEIAKERATCGYKPAMDKAEELLKRISQQIKQM
ncbi:MAG: tetratricopeptide repeat protein [candidate division Zixibacteria bacterium]|nr:tetratricopeptide repeat protein [candidate division Zixibacteria bacterium]